MDIQPVTLEGNTVRLEPLTPQHAAELAEIATPDLFVHHFPPPEFSENGFKMLIQFVSQYPDWCLFAIILKETGKAIGVTAYLDIQPRNRTLEIGFTWIGKPYQGTKVNPECKYLLLSHAFEDQEALRVQIKTDSRNLHSQNAITKLGAVREGVLRKQMITLDGYVRDTVVYSIIDSEWGAVKEGLTARLQ
ncbi:MAG TPA: GNAT family protein [Phototrophicaceae bacterium]|jgi:RimJ/RimL family protein N-acetyltransferase|nr:GNAT family protein [Phototrophicaceae bacterium]